MQCPTDGNQTLDGEEDENSDVAELTADAEAADAWAPDPSEPMDFKATMAATERAAIGAPSEPSTPQRLNTTWLTLGILVAFCLGVMFYLANSG